MNLDRVVDRLKDNYRRYGLTATIHDVECRLLNSVIHFEILKAMVVKLSDVTDPEMFEAPGFEGRFVELDALLPFARAGAHDLDLAFLHEAFRHGDRCYAIFAGEALAAYGWYSKRPTTIDERFVLHFDPAYTYMYKGYTVPAYRGRRLHAVGMCRALRAFTEEGQKGLVSYVASNNFASLKSVARMGYRIFGDVYLSRAAGHWAAYATPGCAAYGFRVEATRAAGVVDTAPNVGSPFSWR
jgi:hypothetical protein